MKKEKKRHYLTLVIVALTLFVVGKWAQETKSYTDESVFRSLLPERVENPGNVIRVEVGDTVYTFYRRDTHQ